MPEPRTNLPPNPRRGDLTQHDGVEWRRLPGGVGFGLYYNPATKLWEGRVASISDLPPPYGGPPYPALGQVLNSQGVGVAPIWTANPFLATGLQIADANFYLTLTTNPFINFDVGDYFIYVRSLDQFQWNVGGNARAMLNANGDWRHSGYARVGSLTPPVSTSPGDLTAVRIFPGNDPNFALAMAGTTPNFVWDAGDYEFYDRTANSYNWVVGSVIRAVLDGGRSLLVGGYARIGSLTTPTNTNNGDLTAVRFIVNDDANFSLGFQTSSPFNPVLAWDSGDWLIFDRASNGLGFYVGGTQRFWIYSDGSWANSGYVRVGSNAVPANTTAGDLTAVRAFINNDSNFNLQFFGGSNWPTLTFDNGDYFTFDRANNKLIWVGAGAARAYLDTAGGMQLTGNLQVGNATASGYNGLTVDAPTGNYGQVLRGTGTGATVWGWGVQTDGSYFLDIPAVRQIANFQTNGDFYLKQYANGSLSIVGTKVTSSSDARSKREIDHTVEYGLAEVEKVEPHRYTWLDDPDSTPQVGFFAQDFIDVVPEAVGKPAEDGGFYGLHENALIATLWNAVKELSARVAQLEAKPA